MLLLNVSFRLFDFGFRMIALPRGAVHFDPLFDPFVAQDYDVRYLAIREFLSGFSRHNGPYRYRFDGHARVLQLIARDTPILVDYRLMSRRDFAVSYLAMYSEAEPVPGFFYTLLQKFKTLDSACSSMDVYFDSVTRVKFSFHERIVPVKHSRVDVDIPYVIVYDVPRVSLSPTVSVPELFVPLTIQYVDDEDLHWYISTFVTSRVSYMLGDVYDNHQNHYKAFYYRVGELITILQHVREIVHIPGDGIGAGSLACHILGIPWFSSEPNSVALDAVSIGLISQVMTYEEHLKLYPDALYLLSFLSRFVNYQNLPRRAIIYDNARILYPGFHWVGSSFLLQTNCDIQFGTLLLQDARLADISRMQLAPMRSESPFIEAYLKQRELYDSLSDILAVVDATHVDCNSRCFMVRERKFNDARPTFSGQVYLVNGHFTRVKHSRTRCFFPGGYYSVDPGQLSRRLLSQKYDLGAADVVTLPLPFDPHKIAKAFRFGRVIEVSVVNIRVVGNIRWTTLETRIGSRRFLGYVGENDKLQRVVRFVSSAKGVAYSHSRNRGRDK